jgi:predicted secreted protein
VNSCTEGKETNIRSSFSITLEKKNENGELISRNIVGNPSVKRKGVSSYKIDRVFSDKSGRNLVFIIEKQVKDKNGTSIRYMVETIRL